jgi:hypothetical protein
MASIDKNKHPIDPILGENHPNSRQRMYRQQVAKATSADDLRLSIGRLLNSEFHLVTNRLKPILHLTSLERAGVARLSPLALQPAIQPPPVRKSEDCGLC